MNDDLLKKAGGGHYFKELIERIFDILLPKLMSGEIRVPTGEVK